MGSRHVSAAWFVVPDPRKDRWVGSLHASLDLASAEIRKLLLAGKRPRAFMVEEVPVTVAASLRGTDVLAGLDRVQGESLDGSRTFTQLVRAYQRRLISLALKTSRTKREAARKLGISPPNFSLKLAFFGFRKRRKPSSARVQPPQPPSSGGKGPERESAPPAGLSSQL